VELYNTKSTSTEVDVLFMARLWNAVQTLISNSVGTVEIN